MRDKPDALLRCLARDLGQAKDPDQHLTTRGLSSMWTRMREDHVADSLGEKSAHDVTMCLFVSCTGDISPDPHRCEPTEQLPRMSVCTPTTDTDSL